LSMVPFYLLGDGYSIKGNTIIVKTTAATGGAFYGIQLVACDNIDVVGNYFHVKTTTTGICRVLSLANSNDNVFSGNTVVMDNASTDIHYGVIIEADSDRNSFSGIALDQVHNRANDYTIQFSTNSDWNSFFGGTDFRGAGVNDLGSNNAYATLRSI